MANRQNNFADRLRYCMARMNFKQKFVAEQVGVSQPAVAKWLAGDTRKVQADVLFRLADLFNVNPRWLSDGQGQPWVSAADDWIHETEQDPEPRPAAAAQPAPAKRGHSTRPRAESYTLELDLPPEPGEAQKAAQAACLEETEEASEPRAKSECEDRCRLYASVPACRLVRGRSPLVPKIVPDESLIDAVIPKSGFLGHDPKACRLFTVSSDAMSPSICPGDQIVVDITEQPQLHFGAVYLVYWQNQGALARIAAEPDGSVLLQFDNTAYRSRRCRPGQFEKLIHIVGQVLIRQGSTFLPR